MHRGLVEERRLAGRAQAGSFLCRFARVLEVVTLVMGTRTRAVEDTPRIEEAAGVELCFDMGLDPVGLSGVVSDKLLQS